MPNWDDQFDLDDYNPKKPNPKQDKKPKKNQDDDFFDLDQLAPIPNKLPTLNKPNPPPMQQKSKNNYDDYEEIDEEVEEVKSPKKQISNTKPAEKNNYYEQLDDEEEIKPKSIKKIEQVKKPIVKEPPKPAKQQEDQDFYESLQENKSKLPLKSQPQVIKKEEVEEQEDPYEEEFDQYGQDFEEIQQKPAKEATLAKKSLTTGNLKPKEKGLKEPEKFSQKIKTEQKKLVINTNKVFTNKQEKAAPPLPKPPLKQNSSKQPSKKIIQPPKKPVEGLHNAASQQKPLQKSASKRSLQSNDSRKYLGNSKVSARKRTVQSTSSRHIDLVQRQFPEEEERIGEYPPQRLSRLNQQVREMIRKFNEQLNELINRNMILLKDKPMEKTPNIDEKQRILQEQLKSQATALEVVENELDRLRGREGELRQEEYQLIMEKRIEEAKESIVKVGKQVTRLKAEVNSEGNKLSRQEVQKRIAQQLHQIKLMLIQAKKEEEKNQTKLEKVQKMAEDLQSKNSDKDYQLSQQIDNAKDKGVTLNVRQVTRKKYEQLKLKSITLQNHKRVTESLSRTKCQHISHQIDQLRITLRSLDSQINNVLQSVQHCQEESIKLIKKAKENPKLNTVLADNLDKIMKSIEENQALNYYEVRTQGNKSQASERPLKNSMYQNMGKEKPAMRGNSSKKEPASATRQKEVVSQPPLAPANDEINLMKPNFMKKKEKHEASPAEDKEKVNKLYQRVWNQEQEKKKQEEQKKRVEEEKRKEKQALLAAAAEEDKKKPFNLKKNRMNEQKQKTAEPSPQVSKIAETLELKIQAPEVKQVKQQEKPSIGPKFMRLNKKDKNTQSSKNDISIEKPIQEIKKPIEELPKAEPKQQEDQPVFVPKRFNLRNKIQKKDEGYIPTVQKSIDIKKEEKKEEPKIEIKKQEPKKEYAPNFSFKEEDPYKVPFPEGKKVENDIKIQVPEQKPKFNLRLRDRKKEAVEQSYIPSRLTQVVQPKSKVETGGYNPFDRQPIKKEESKSYLPSFKQIQEKPIKQVPEIIAPTKEINKQPSFNAPKEPINNPYAQPVKEQPVVNPYAPKEDLPKREKEGPLKKNKLLNKGPKEKINIYEQAEDLTEPHHVPIHQPQIPVNQPPKQVNLAKTNELDLNAMLGIKKKEKVNDLDDLLGEVSVGKKKEKKKNTDFFNDLEL